MSESDVPWAALYRRAISSGIGDAAFWRMSPAALIEITSGMNQGSPRSRRVMRRGGQGAAVQTVGSLADCP